MKAGTSSTIYLTSYSITLKRIVMLECFINFFSEGLLIRQSQFSVIPRP